MPVKKNLKKKNIKKIKQKKVAKPMKKTIKAKEKAKAKGKALNKAKDCWDYTPGEWQKKETLRIENEFKKYASDLEPGSGKTIEECARTAMTLAHHDTKKALKVLEKFKKDSRAPMWIDCGIDECKMMLWDDTVGVKISVAEDVVKEAAEEVFAQKIRWNKDVIIGALKVSFKKKKVKFIFGDTVKLRYKDKVIGEDKAEFIIDDCLLIGIKPGFAEWVIRFKDGQEGKDLRQGDLENIEQGMIYSDEGEELQERKTLEESFNEFYGQQFYNILEMSEKPVGILLDFSGKRLYGETFSLPNENGWFSDGCSGWCPGCLQELKCETAQELREEEDKKRYRILKKLMKEIVEIEEKIKASAKPITDLRYEIEIMEKIKKEIAEKIKKEKNKKVVNNLEKESRQWEHEMIALNEVCKFKTLSKEDRERLDILKKKYEVIKKEMETDEYKNDVEGLEVYYGKAEPSDPENGACYHDPLCYCDEYDSIEMDDDWKDYGEEKKNNNNNNIDDLRIEDIPF